MDKMLQVVRIFTTRL